MAAASMVAVAQVVFKIHQTIKEVAAAAGLMCGRAALVWPIAKLSQAAAGAPLEPSL